MLALWLCEVRAQKTDNDLCPPFCLGESCPPAPTMMLQGGTEEYATGVFQAATLVLELRRSECQ